MTTFTRPRNPVKPIRKPVVAELTLHINGTPYVVIATDPGPDNTKSFRLVKDGNADSVYDVALGHDGLVTCDCPSYEATYRGNGLATCKHGQALIQVGLLEAPSTVEGILKNFSDTPAPVEAAPESCAEISRLEPPARVVAPFDRDFHRAQDAVAKGNALWLAHRDMFATEPLPAEAPCCPDDDPAPCAACVQVPEPAERTWDPTVGVEEDEDPRSGPLDDGGGGWDAYDDDRWTITEPIVEPDPEVIQLIEDGAELEAEGEGPLEFATPECFAAIAEGRAEPMREFGLVPMPGWVTPENRDDLMADDAILEGWASPRDKAMADGMKARRLAGPPAPDVEPEPRTLAEQVDDHAAELRALGSPLGDLLAERAESLAGQIRALEATTVEQFRDRRDTMLAADMIRAEARRAAAGCN